MPERADALLSLRDSSVGSLLSAAKEPWAMRITALAGGEAKSAIAPGTMVAPGFLGSHPKIQEQML